MKLPSKVKKMWVSALRSGQYKQAVGRLYKRGGYCCLGVLQQCTHGAIECDEGVNGKPVLSEAYSFPTSNYWKAVGAKNAGATEGTLAELNDTGKLSFKQIADWIEANVKSY